jgi:hypothetical protein
MRNISGQYKDLLEGKMTQAQFLRNARMMFPNYITNHNSFQDSVTILKQKGMLVEGDAVKGTPDKTPEYDYPTQPGKYKKVVQEPEVDEQDGIYPATTLTDIPKEEVSKPIKSKTRPDGLEDIKDNDTKNEMKKVKVVKENIEIHNKGKKNLDEITDTEADKEMVRKFIAMYETEPSKFEKLHKQAETQAATTNDVKFKHLLSLLNRAKAGALQSLANQDKFEADREGMNENQRSFDDIFKDFIETDDTTEIKSFLKIKGKEAISKIKAKLPQLKDQARQKLAKLMKVELDEARVKKTPNKELDIRERLKPAITKLVQEVLDEMGQE